MDAADPWPLSGACARWAAVRATPGVRPAVLALCGALSPAHRGHIAALRQAVIALEASGFTVLGAWLVPWPDAPGPGPILRTYLAQLAAAEVPGATCGAWAAQQRCRPAIGMVLQALKAAMCAAAPGLESLSVFCVCAVTTYAAAFTALQPSARQGLVLVPRPREESPPSKAEELFITAQPVDEAVRSCSGCNLRDMLRAGADVRTQVPEAIARVLLAPSEAERRAFGKDIAELSPALVKAELLRNAAAWHAEAVQPLRERLEAWLIAEHGSVSRGLSIFDLDADGFLSMEELGRAVLQAGVAAGDAPLLLSSLDLSPVHAQSIEQLSLRITGECPNPKADPAPSAGATKLSFSTPAQKLADAAKELVRLQSELKAGVLALFTDEQRSRPVELREEELLKWLATSPWHHLARLRDARKASLLILSSEDGMLRVCQRLLGTRGPSKTEIAEYVNLRNDVGWTALQLAALNGHRDVCEVLLRGQADANASTVGTGLTPLMLASSCGNVGSVLVLLDMKRERDWSTRADPYKMSADGRTALDFVRGRIRSQRAPPGERPAGHGSSASTMKLRVEDQPESYGEIQCALMSLMGSGTSLTELRQNILLGNDLDYDGRKARYAAEAHARQRKELLGLFA